jgi:TolB-like protein
MGSREVPGWGNKLGVSAQLLEGIAGLHLWAKNFDAAIEDIFGMQDRITETAIALTKPVFVACGIAAEGQVESGV